MPTHTELTTAERRAAQADAAEYRARRQRQAAYRRRRRRTSSHPITRLLRRIGLTA